MTERDYRAEGADWDGRRRDAVDRELDGVLANYASVEPRPGLEERVLASLRVERQKASDGGFWRWSVAAALAVALIVMAWTVAWKFGRPRPDNTAQPPTTITPGSQPGKEVLPTSEKNAARPRKPIPVRRSTERRAPPPVIVAAEPKLEQFPSPQPLSEQERILAKYVSDYPQHAALIAQARTEALRRDAAEEIRESAAGSNEQSR
jgi:hypothetical protein